MSRRLPLLMLYDDRSDITPIQLEKILQAVVWLADGVILPAYAQPSPLIDSDRRRLISMRLGELAEAGYIHQWRIEPDLPQVSTPSWWPATTKAHCIDSNTYTHLQRGIVTGVSLYHDDMLRGIGRPPKALVSGISEFVSLRDSLWTIGLARFLGADYLL